MDWGNKLWQRRSICVARSVAQVESTTLDLWRATHVPIWHKIKSNFLCKSWLNPSWILLSVLISWPVLFDFSVNLSCIFLLFMCWTKQESTYKKVLILVSFFPLSCVCVCVFTAGCGLEFLLVLCGLELSWSCPRHCICYTAPSTVSCQAHNFLSVPEGIPPDSERIFLQNNKIHRLLRGHFSSNTVTLWIYSNNITYIEPSTFHGFTLLEELDLGDNRHLRSLAEDTFHGLNRLNALHLYRCGLSSLPNNIFQGLRNLQYLYLQVYLCFWLILQPRLYQGCHIEQTCIWMWMN